MWQLAAVAAAGSLFGSHKQNKNAYAQQLQIVGDTKAAYKNLENLGEESKQTVGFALTKNEIKNAREMAKHVAQKADSNTAGASALYAYSNFIQQKAYTKGTVTAKGEGVLRDYGKQAEAKLARATSGINEAEANKKGAFEMILDATMAGASGYAMGKGL